MNESALPQVSVVVPTFRRPDLLARCLRALCEQHFDRRRYEILVVDDDEQGSARPVVEGVAGVAPRAPAIRCLSATGTRGPAGARNTGWRAARGDIIAFTDDDTIPDARWLAEGCAALARAPDASAAAGRIEMPSPERPEGPTDYERDALGLARAEFATANTFVRRAALARVGGFDERFTRAWREDSDLMFVLMERVGPVIAAPAARVVHPVRRAHWGVSIGQQAKVYFDALLYKKHRHLYRARIRATPPWHYYAAVAALAVAFVALCMRWWPGALAAFTAWLVITALFCLHRLRGTAKTPSHVAEMIVTSMLIPPVSLYWRVRGSIAFNVVFL